MNKTLNIALLAMSMDIGGAETHVLTLADYLHRLGHHVVVISSGGVYENDLKNMGIPVLNAPLASKSPQTIRKSYKSVKKYCIDHHIDIVHAHGRIPSLIGQMVSKKLKIPMVTTVHAIYKTSLLYRLLSFYGEKTICISQDTRDHVVNNYGVKAEKTIILPNGIDTEKFSPHKAINELEELSLDQDAFKIAYISRMTGALAERALVVTRALNQYSEEHNMTLELLLIGDGDDFNQLKESLSDFKVSSDFKYHILGKRRDIPEILNAMDLTTCVSRAALESMASATPVILVGGEGFEGLLTEDNYERLSHDNFTARKDTKAFNENTFMEAFAEIAGDENKAKRQSLGAWLRKKIEQDYDSESITEKTVDVYRNVLERRQ